MSLDATANGVAIVGIGLRFPGADTAEGFWRNLSDSVESIRREPSKSGEAWVKAGGTLAHVEEFDAGFFGLSKAEAEVMDPQHRLFLECCWEALEDAGCPADVEKRRIGVFAGCSLSTYLLANVIPARGYQGRPDELPVLLGNDKDYLSTRVSYLLNFTGPSIGIQTACSSSLVAVHFACQSILAGECDMAIAGGASVRLPQNAEYKTQEGGYLSPSGRCRPFDEAADGAVFSNGAGCVLLKRLGDAVADRDRIYAVIRGSAVNNDGSRKAGFTAPSVDGQAEAILEALGISGIEAGDIGSIDAHGTGTPLGDPIEIAALTRAFRHFTARESFCAIQSVKANLGHLECAAGIASLIKASLALRHRELPPACNFERLNPKISAARGPFYINTHLTSWTQTPRRAGVSSFGIGGTNAHVVLEEAPERDERWKQWDGPLVLPISARSRESLQNLIAAYGEVLEKAGVDAAGVCQSAARRRAHHEWRAAVCGESSDELRRALREWKGAEESEAGPRLAVVYGGQGGQWAGMGREMWNAEAGYRHQWEECREALLAAGGPDLREEMDEEEIAYTQGGVWALQCGLTAVWRSWGIEAEAVVGHSMGEVAAAWASGALSLEAAGRVMAERGKVLGKAAGRGMMVAVEAGGEEVEGWLEGQGDLEIAARNGPGWIAVSGRRAAVEGFLEELRRRCLDYRVLQTSGVAGHSREMEGLWEELEERLAGLEAKAGRIPMRSTVTGEWVKGDALGSGYWGRNLREPVLFEKAIRGLAREGYGMYLEVGPHPVLGAGLEGSAEAEGKRVRVMHSMRRQGGERREMLEGLAALYRAGRKVCWEGVYPEQRPMTPLPFYSWNRQRCWIEETERRPDHGHGGHPLLGHPLESSVDPGTWFWESEWRLDGMPWARDHQIDGEAIVPAAVYIEMASAAFAKTEGAEAEIDVLEMPRALLLAAQGRYRIQTVLDRREGGVYGIRISSRQYSPDGGAWRLHATGILSRRCLQSDAASARRPIAEIRERMTEEITGAAHYAAAATHGIEYGPSFQCVRRVFRGGPESLAEVTMPGRPHGDRSSWHPAWLDGWLQSLQVLAEGPWVPVKLQGLRLAPNSHTSVYVHGRLLPASNNRTAHCALTVLSETGEVVAECASLELARLDPEPAYRIEWREEPIRGSQTIGRRQWLLLDDTGGGLGADLAKELATRGQQPTVEDVSSAAIDRIARGEWQAVVYLARGRTGFDEEACSRPLEITQRAALVSRGEPLLLYLVTQAVHQPQFTAEQLLSAAPLWGFRRTAATEYPHLRITAIDIGGRADLPALAGEMVSAHFEEEVALRGQRRWVANLVQSATGSVPSAGLPVAHANGSYVITGGLGGLGLVTAEWLAAKGARHLALIGRRAPSPEAQQRIDIMHQGGVAVRVIAADVTSKPALSAGLRQIRSTMPPIRGVVHAAGVLDDGLIENLTPDRFRSVLLAKAGGAWHLHELLQDCTPDWFVLYSSAAALLGSPGQANHAAANAFLDALASHRHALGLPALSVNWGPWRAHGAAAGERAASLARRGLASLDAADAFGALEQFLSAGLPQAAKMSLDFNAWCGYYPNAASSPFLSRLKGHRATPAAPARTQTSRQTEALLVNQAAEVLRCPPAAIDPSRPLREFGLDSLRALELRNRIETALGIRISATVMWRYPVISALARHVHERVQEAHSRA